MTANIDTKKLQVVSKLLWAIISDLKAKGCNAKDCLSTDDGYDVQVEDFDTIAATMLKLAEENERLKKKVTKMESIPVKVREVSDLEFEPTDD